MVIFCKYEKGHDIPLNTCTAHRLWSSDVGIVAPTGWRMPMKASVGFSSSGGKQIYTWNAGYPELLNYFPKMGKNKCILWQR